MPAGLPGATPVQNAANPSTGTPVIFDLISGPKGSPKDNDKDYATGTGVANANASTGGLSTGIGFGLNLGPQGIKDITPNFNDDYTPGVTKPDKAASANSTVMYIGGGKSEAAGKYSPGGQAPATDPAGLARDVPYTTGFGIGAAGGGGSRDAGAGPAFTGFPMKMVTAAADIAAAGVIETGFTNRSGLTIPLGYSTFGSGGTASVAPAMTKEEKEAADEELRKAEERRVKEVLSDPEKKALVKAMDEKAKEEEERIRKEEDEKKSSKLPPITGTFNVKESGDKLDTAAPPSAKQTKPTGSKDK